MRLLEKYRSISACSYIKFIFLFGFEKFARKVKSPLKYTGESKYMSLRLAAGISKTGYFGLIETNIIKVATPNMISRRLKIKQRIAQNQVMGLVRRGGRRTGSSFSFLMFVYGHCVGKLFCFMGCFEIENLCRGVFMIGFGEKGGGGGRESISLVNIWKMKIK